MIDTDKYENITPERWAVDEDDPYRVVDAQECTIARTDFIDIEEERTWQLANAQLIADAPLLLAEVKRLQRELDTQYKYIEWLEEFAPKAGEYNLAWDAYELAKGIHWTQMEEEE